MVARHQINLIIYQSTIKAEYWQTGTKCRLKFTEGLSVTGMQVQCLVSPHFLSFSMLKLSVYLPAQNEWLLTAFSAAL